MGKKATVSALVEGGKASAGPPIGPALGPTGVNLYQVVQKINETTKDFAGLRVPVKITVDTETKAFDVEVGLPPTSALILREAKQPKGSGKPGEQKVADLSFDQIVKVAKIKKDSLMTTDIKRAVRAVLGTCISTGVTVDGKDCRVVQKELLEGKYDDQLSKES
ncbi:MAG: 50S ribosomal protein L11 [Promethearchaeati archaeon SRVP18_Atabeyarchaeia-1]